MPYTPRSRDRFKNLSAVLTGVVTFATVTTAGTATGLAARETALRDQVREQQARVDAALEEAAQRPQTALVIRERPQRTVVHPRVVHAASGTGVTRVGPGGTVTSPPPQSSTNASTPPLTSARAAGAVPRPAAAPKQVSAPSSGS